MACCEFMTRLHISMAYIAGDKHSASVGQLVSKRFWARRRTVAMATRRAVRVLVGVQLRPDSTPALVDRSIGELSAKNSYSLASKPWWNTLFLHRWWTRQGWWSVHSQGGTGLQALRSRVTTRWPGLHFTAVYFFYKLNAVSTEITIFFCFAVYRAHNLTRLVLVSQWIFSMDIIAILVPTILDLFLHVCMSSDSIG